VIETEADPRQLSGHSRTRQKSSLCDRTSFVYTIFVRQNITFNADKSDIELAREEAQSQNTTLHELFRDWLKVIAGRKARVQEYRALIMNCAM